MADDRPDGERVSRKGDQHPGGERREVRHQRQQAGDEQERRRIEPGKITIEAAPERGVFGRLVDGPVVDRRRVTFEHEPAGGPDIDEIRRDAVAVGVDHPVAERKGGSQKHRLRDAKRKQHQFGRLAQAKVAGGGWSGIGEGHLVRNPKGLPHDPMTAALPKA